jgi:hypothetical protein
MALSQADITNAYQTTLGRAPDAAGLAYWQGQNDLSGFSSAAAPEMAIKSAYQSSFGRPPEQAGYDYWTNQSAGNAGFNYDAAIKAGAQGYDVNARDDTTRAGIGASGANVEAANLRYNSDTNQWSNYEGPTAAATPMADPNAYTRNPYLDQMANDIQRRSGQALDLGLSSIRSNAVGVGGLGGSRQGVAEGLAIAGANDNLSGNLAGLLGGDYTNSMNRNLQRYGIDTNAAMTRSSLDLQRYGVDTNAAITRSGQDLQRYGVDTSASLTNQGQMQNFYSTNRGQDLQQLGLGAQLYGQGNAGFLGQGQGMFGLGSTQQQAPFNVLNNANSAITPYTGYGGTTTGAGQYGGGFSGAAGGALAGAQIGRNLGFGGSSSNGYMPITNGGGFTNTPNYLITG